MIVFHKIRSRLILVFTILSIFPLLTVGILSYNRSFKAIEGVSVESYSNIAVQLNKSIELLFRDGEKFLTIGTSEEAVAFLQKEKEDQELYDASYDIIMLFKDYRRLFHFDEYIKGIYIIGLEGFCISEKRGLYSLRHPLSMNPTVQRILSSTEDTVIIPNEVVDYAPDIHLDKVITLGRLIRKPVTHELLGVVIVDIDLKAFQSLCQDLAFGNAGQFYVVAPEKEVLFPPDTRVYPEMLDTDNLDSLIKDVKGSFIQRADGGDVFYVFNTLLKTGWKIIGQIPRRALMSTAYQIRNVTFALIITSALLSVLIYFFVSEALTSPIRHLQKIMKEAENGNFDVRAYTDKRDEIYDLCQSFNAMIRKIHELMQLTIEEQEALKKYEMKALQAQINPHFLYNSLDAIIWMAEAGQKDEVVHITKNLSSFFRVSLSKGEDWIPVRDELLHVANYLEIQQMRYRDILRYDIDVDEDILNCSILKILLQPIVENALYHGIKNKRSGGEILLTGLRKDRFLEFAIKDTGAGMPPERLTEIRNALQDKSRTINSPGGFGLKNIYQRLKLYYGDDADMILDSSVGEGSVITILLPLKEGVC